MRILLLLLVPSLALCQNPGANALTSQRGLLANIPVPCQDAQLYFATDQPAGQNVYGCLNNSWSLNGTAQVIVTSGLIGKYLMVDASGATVPDSSGNGNNATMGSTAPSITSAGLSFAYSTKSWVEMPSALNGAKTISVMYWTAPPTPIPAQWWNSSPEFEILWGDSAGSGAVSAPGMYLNNFGTISGGGYQSHCTPTVLTAGTQNTATPAGACQMHMLTLVEGTNASTDPDVLYIDGTAVTSYYGGRGANSGVGVVGHYQLGNGISGVSASRSRFAGTIHAALFYSTRLAAADVAQNYAALVTIVGGRGATIAPVRPNSAITNSLVAVGDSTTLGAGWTPWTSDLSALTSTYTVTNCGIPGATVYTMRFTFGDNCIQNLSSGPMQVVVLWGGVNNIISSSETASAIVDDLAAVANSIRAAGAKVVIGTLMSLCSYETQRNAVNTQIYARWRTFADGLADVAANSLVGANSASCGATNTYFQGDGIHPNSTGYAVVGPIMAAAVNALANNLSGAGKRPVCTDANGTIYAGTNTAGVLACP